MRAPPDAPAVLLDEIALAPPPAADAPARVLLAAVLMALVGLRPAQGRAAGIAACESRRSAEAMLGGASTVASEVVGAALEELDTRVVAQRRLERLEEEVAEVGVLRGAHRHRVRKGSQSSPPKSSKNTSIMGTATFDRTLQGK